MSSNARHKSRREQLVEEQAEALAMRYLVTILNSRDDLEFTPEVHYSPVSEYRVDLLIRLIRMSLVHEPNLIVERKLGFEVKGSLGIPDKIQDFEFKTTRDVQNQSLELVKRGWLYPLCLCVFNVRNNQGYFRWVIEPTFYRDRPHIPDDQGWALRFGRQSHSLGLFYQPSGTLQDLDQNMFNTLVSTVESWYDRLDDFLELYPSG
jgi:hypothetical protein